MKSICLSLLIVTGTIASARGEPFRTDINPALIYYRAFLLAPDLSPVDRTYLFDNPQNWRGQKLPERFGELVARYDNQFKLVRLAAQATVQCDWGIDLSPGPNTLLPQLARNKSIAQAARLRAMWDLQQGRPEEARDDLLAAFALGRNSSRDGTVISVLVQIAVENIISCAVAENFHQFNPEILKQLVDGFDAAPALSTVASCMEVERISSHDWFAAKILDWQKENPGNDAKVMVNIRDLFESFQGTGDGAQPDTTVWPRVLKASGGTSDGVIKLIRDSALLYPRLTEILTLPYGQYEDPMKQFSAEIQNSPNPFVTLMFPAMEKCRPKEFAIQVQLAMVRAAVEYKLHGDDALKSVTDPCGNGPFEFQRFVFEGVDRGFELKSAYEGRGFPEVLIFVEKDGSPFQVNGKNAGQILPK